MRTSFSLATGSIFVVTHLSLPEYKAKKSDEVIQSITLEKRFRTAIAASYEVVYCLPDLRGAEAAIERALARIAAEWEAHQLSSLHLQEA